MLPICLVLMNKNILITFHTKMKRHCKTKHERNHKSVLKPLDAITTRKLHYTLIKMTLSAAVPPTRCWGTNNLCPTTERDNISREKNNQTTHLKRRNNLWTRPHNKNEPCLQGSNTKSQQFDCPHWTF